MKVERVVCPLDFSVPSEQALAAAIDVAPRFGAALTLVHVWEMRILLLPAGAGVVAVPPDPMEIERVLGVLLEEWRARAQVSSGLEVSAKLLEGPPWERIVDEATADDLIVVGTHGRTGLKRVLLGSVAERVVRHARGPVLTVRASPASLKA